MKLLMIEAKVAAQTGERKIYHVVNNITGILVGSNHPKYGAKGDDATDFAWYADLITIGKQVPMQ